jgi:hypothetical protein
MTDDKLRILQMLENGTINASEAADLLNTLDTVTEDNSIPHPEEQNVRAKWMKIEITDVNSGKKRVNLRIPLAILKIAGKSGRIFTKYLDNDTQTLLDQDAISDLINEGQKGVIVDVVDEEDGEKVLITLE